MGAIYFMRLKHDPDGKMSTRAAGSLSLDGVPSKNNRSYKDGRSLYSTTACRLGEMEVGTLLTLSAGGGAVELQRLLCAYSSSEEDRRNLIRELLGSHPDHPGRSPYAIGRVAPSGRPTLPQQALSIYLRACGLELVRDDGVPVAQAIPDPPAFVPDVVVASTPLTTDEDEEDEGEE